MERAYVLQHVTSSTPGVEEVKLIGVYSSEKEATQAIARLKGLPGFSKFPDAFHIDPYPINRDHWAEGFATL